MKEISNKNLKKELIDVIDMEKKVDSLEELILEEKNKTEKELKTANSKIKNYEMITKENDAKLKEKDDVIKKLSEIIEKSKIMPSETLITLIGTKWEE